MVRVCDHRDMLPEDEGFASGPQCTNEATHTNCDRWGMVVCASHKCRCSKPIRWGDVALTLGPFRVLAFVGEQLWIAQGVDFDLCVQASTPTELVDTFWRFVISEIALCLEHDTQPLVRSRHPSMKEFQARYETAKGLGLTLFPRSDSEARH